MELENIILESWSQGVLVGGIVILVLVTLANIRRGILLHKLILFEVYVFPPDGQELQVTVYQLVLTLGHGTFIFFPDPIYGWQVTLLTWTVARGTWANFRTRYLSSTATLLYLSFFVHNVVSWMKIKPFLPRLASKVFISTVILVIPYWIAETYFNFRYFNAIGDNTFDHLRPWEIIFRSVNSV